MWLRRLIRGEGREEGGPPVDLDKVRGVLNEALDDAEHKATLAIIHRYRDWWRAMVAEALALDQEERERTMRALNDERTRLN